jgi:hypothetical protein
MVDNATPCRLDCKPWAFIARIFLLEYRQRMLRAIARERPRFIFV